MLCTGKTTSIGVDFLLRELRVCRDTSESQAKLPESLRLSRISILAPLITEMGPKCKYLDPDPHMDPSFPYLVLDVTSVEASGRLFH